MVGINKETFFRSINKEIELSKDFYMKIYGYSYYDKEFEVTVISLLEGLQLKKAITGYYDWKQEYEAKQLAEDKKVAKWYAERVTKEYDERQRKATRPRREQQHLFRGFS